MDLVPYQLEPARQALRQPRQRILIADASARGVFLRPDSAVDSGRSGSAWTKPGAGPSRD